MARILIVDNEKDTLEILSIAVRLLGHTPLTAQSGAKALEAVQQLDPDLVLLDYMMPEMDGVETLRRMRALEAGRRLPALLVTASPDRTLEEQTAFLGATCVQKPLSLPVLTEVVAQHSQEPGGETKRRYGT